MRGWAIYVIILSIYTLIFESESHDKNSSEHPEVTSVKEILQILYNLFKKPNYRLYLLFSFTSSLGFFVNSNITWIYLIDDIHYPREKLSLYDSIILPFSLVYTLWIGHIANKKPLQLSKYLLILSIIVDLTTINIILYFNKEI